LSAKGFGYSPSYSFIVNTIINTIQATYQSVYLRLERSRTKPQSLNLISHHPTAAQHGLQLTDLDRASHPCLPNKFSLFLHIISASFLVTLAVLAGPASVASEASEASEASIHRPSEFHFFFFFSGPGRGGLGGKCLFAMQYACMCWFFLGFGFFVFVVRERGQESGGGGG
jgi:hypothetical protein